MISNPTGYNINVFIGGTDIANRYAYCPIYTILPVLLPNQGNLETNLIVQWSGSGEDKINFVLSETNPGIGQSLVAPGGSSSIIIAGDGVGLAKATQLPGSLTGTGFLKTSVLETVGLMPGDLNMDGSKNVGVTLQNPLPAGTANIGKVDVNALPELPAGTNNVGKVDVNSLPALPAGTNQIGHVLLDSPVMPQAATSGIVSSGQVAVTTAATAIVNGVVSGRQIVIQNMDASNPLYLGPATVTVANSGLKIPAGGSFTLDVVPGSTIAIYGIGSAAVTAGYTVIN
jgi:hypothetical protein